MPVEEVDKKPSQPKSPSTGGKNVPQEKRSVKPFVYFVIGSVLVLIISALILG